MQRVVWLPYELHPYFGLYSPQCCVVFRTFSAEQTSPKEITKPKRLYKIYSYHTLKQQLVYDTIGHHEKIGY